jgi:hypothetical protein
MHVEWDIECVLFWVTNESRGRLTGHEQSGDPSSATTEPARPPRQPSSAAAQQRDDLAA